MPHTRRDLLLAATAAAAAGVSTQAQGRRRPRPRLRHRPPRLASPLTVTIQRPGLVGLEAGQDYVLRLPRDRAVAGALTVIGGHNVVVVGGEIAIPAWGEDRWPLPNGFPRQTISISGGPVGGSFRLLSSSPGERVDHAQSEPIDRRATADELRAAIEALPSFGAGSVDVAGPAGGPWEVVPRRGTHSARLAAGPTSFVGGARPAVVLETPTSTDGRGLLLRNQTGVVHLEGLWLHGAGMCEGINLDLPAPRSRVQIQSCRVDVGWFVHRSHHHPDAIQAYNGPGRLRTDRCTFRSPYQAAMLQPAAGGQVEAPSDWTFRRTEFAVYGDRAESAVIKSHERDVVAASWTCQFERCHIHGSRAPHPPYVDTGANGKNPQRPAGVTWRAPSRTTCDPGRGQCGRDYRSPGYL